MHEILENGELVGRVLGELGGTLRLLDDLEENLAVFDARLRHMREDIAGAQVDGFEHLNSAGGAVVGGLRLLHWCQGGLHALLIVLAGQVANVPGSH